MRATLTTLLLALALSAGPGCAPIEPSCSNEIDRTGRRVPLCSDITESAVCDDPGAMAHYIRDPGMRLVLVDGTLATCDTEGRVVCPDGEPAFCLQQPPGTP